MDSQPEIIRVVVTASEYHKAERVFASAANDGFECICVGDDEAALADAIRTHAARAAVVGVCRYSGPLYDALPKAGVIARFGVGHDSIDKDLATRRGLFCTNTPGVLTNAVAEHTIALILAAARRLLVVSDAMQQGQWQPIVGVELKGKTLAVIGCGPIGLRVAQIASFGFSMNVLGCDVAEVDTERFKRDFGFAAVGHDFDKTVVEADFVTLHIPSHSSTHHFMNQNRLSKFPVHAWLINTSRGSVVDEVALFDSISQGQLAGAALDVFECEPYTPVVPDKDLRRLDQVLMTPHVGSSTQEACDGMARCALANIRLACAGHIDEMDLLNPDAKSCQ